MGRVPEKIPITPSQGQDGATSIGWLESPEYRVEIFATAAGPRYDVYDASGVLVARRAEREDLYRIDPALDPAGTMGTPIGLVTDGDLD